MYKSLVFTHSFSESTQPQPKTKALTKYGYGSLTKIFHAIGHSKRPVIHLWDIYWHHNPPHFMGNQTRVRDSQASIHNTIKTIEDEVLELEKQGASFLARLHRLQYSITYKRVLARNLRCTRGRTSRPRGARERDFAPLGGDHLADHVGWDLEFSSVRNFARHRSTSSDIVIHVTQRPSRPLPVMASQTGDQDTQTASIHSIIKNVEEEVLELKKQETDLQDYIARKRALTANLKNSLVPVYRLSNEIILACFGQAVRVWLEENNGADESVVVNQICNEPGAADFTWPYSPAFGISHVSHLWRQLAINLPTLWTSLVVMPNIGRHLGVLRDVLHRVDCLPIAANFRSFGSGVMRSSPGFSSSMEANVQLLHTQRINALTFLNSAPVLSSLLSLITNQPICITGHPSSTTFSSLTSLTIFKNGGPEQLNFTRLKSILSATPQLKTLELQHFELVDAEEGADGAIICLPMLENLTIIQSSPLLYKVLDSLSAPNVGQLKLLLWWPRVEPIISHLFVKNNDNFDLKLPRFPKVWNLTLSSFYEYDGLGTHIISAFPRVTHLTMRSPGQFYESEDLAPLAPLVFQQLQHLTLDFAFEFADRDPQICLTWLPKSKDRPDHPLLISVFDSSDLSTQEASATADRFLFFHYQELQQCGQLDRSSSRLDKYLRWQADGEAVVV
ncbi:hypothetical protein BJ138DRAFT_1179980 [Hygrophoropsis aurantiaca]|uniref:Uncharacterized protein n=1 Tax=Hygrophoropsis aurantiaca TaxID=72124 RepID=A0ACB8ABW1_9AGAM|nr:hypothetical protein BJ138DRAFT_1179980 [Hygrophoropsis aurantiaca]